MTMRSNEPDAAAIAASSCITSIRWVSFSAQTWRT
jgi:hypothetical protein